MRDDSHDYSSSTHQLLGFPKVCSWVVTHVGMPHVHKGNTVIVTKEVAHIQSSCMHWRIAGHGGAGSWTGAPETAADPSQGAQLQQQSAAKPASFNSCHQQDLGLQQPCGEHGLLGKSRPLRVILDAVAQALRDAVELMKTSCRRLRRLFAAVTVLRQLRAVRQHAITCCDARVRCVTQQSSTINMHFDCGGCLLL
jgi:hypothetical protein